MFRLVFPLALSSEPCGIINASILLIHVMLLNPWVYLSFSDQSMFLLFYKKCNNFVPLKLFSLKWNIPGCANKSSSRWRGFCSYSWYDFETLLSAKSLRQIMSAEHLLQAHITLVWLIAAHLDLSNIIKF